MYLNRRRVNLRKKDSKTSKLKALKKDFVARSLKSDSTLYNTLRKNQTVQLRFPKWRIFSWYDSMLLHDMNWIELKSKFLKSGNFCFKGGMRVPGVTPVPSPFAWQTYPYLQNLVIISPQSILQNLLYEDPSSRRLSLTSSSLQFFKRKK